MKIFWHCCSFSSQSQSKINHWTEDGHLASASIRTAFESLSSELASTESILATLRTKQFLRGGNGKFNTRCYMEILRNQTDKHYTTSTHTSHTSAAYLSHHSHKRNLHQDVYFILLNLSLSDSCLSIIIALPFPSLKVLAMIFYVHSILLTLTINLDRYMKVKHGLR